MRHTTQVTSKQLRKQLQLGNIGASETFLKGAVMKYAPRGAKGISKMGIIFMTRTIKALKFRDHPHVLLSRLCSGSYDTIYFAYFLATSKGI